MNRGLVDYAFVAGKISRQSRTKTWLVTKEKFLTITRATFAERGIEITSEGQPYLGAPIGTEECVQLLNG